MNYDHLLTRVWDKQEKRMIYQFTDFKLKPDNIYESSYSYLLAFNPHDKSLQTVKNGEYRRILNTKDRFIPMLCSGRKDQNKKLIYDCDIVKIADGIDYSYHEVVRGDDYPAFEIFPLLYDNCNNLQSALTELFVEVVGNKFLNPDLLPKE